MAIPRAFTPAKLSAITAEREKRLRRRRRRLGGKEGRNLIMSSSIPGRDGDNEEIQVSYPLLRERQRRSLK